MRLGKRPCCGFKLFYFDLPRFCFNPWEEPTAAEHISHSSRSCGCPGTLPPARVVGGLPAPRPGLPAAGGWGSGQSRAGRTAGPREGGGQHTPPGGQSPRLPPCSLCPGHCASPGRARGPWSVGSHALSAALGSGNEGTASLRPAHPPQAPDHDNTPQTHTGMRTRVRTRASCCRPSCRLSRCDRTRCLDTGERREPLLRSGFHSMRLFSPSEALGFPFCLVPRELVRPPPRCLHSLTHAMCSPTHTWSSLAASWSEQILSVSTVLLRFFLINMQSLSL